jgi:GDPmannose 4,6-dehydratase
MKRALITGATGQDGSYLAKLLLEKGYSVAGAVRRTSLSNVARLEKLGIAKDIELVDFDLLELSNIMRVVERTRPDEIYNLAAQSFVSLSFEHPIYTGECDALGVLRLLEAVRSVNPKIRFYQASTSEMFGKVTEIPQTETTPFHPRSPYAVAKLFGHWSTVNYRESYGMHATSGILFNHESPLRGREFVSRKITTSLAMIKHGKIDVFSLGNMNAQRDWGYAPDYVEGMWLTTQQPSASDYVLATGESHSVRDFVLIASHQLGFDMAFDGSAENERGIDRKSGRVIVRVDPKLYRPAEVEYLRGCPQKAEKQLGWKRTTSFERMVALMTETDEKRVRDNQTIL